MKPAWLTDDFFQNALTFLVSQTSYIEPQVVRVLYPELNYAELIPVDTAGNEWAKSITFFSIDQVGNADWYNHLARDVPFADVQRAKHEQAIEMAAVGYRYTTEELALAMQIPGTNLGLERAASARRAAEQFIYNVALYGDTRKTWGGMTNSTLPTIIEYTQTWNAMIAGAGANLNTVIATVLQQFNNVLVNIWVESLTVEMADTVLLPLSVMSLFAMTQLPNTTTNLLQWLQQNNVFTQQTGRPLLIRGIRGLDNAGGGGTGRMVAYTRSPDVIKLHIPMPHRFLAPYQTGVMTWDVPGIFRIGGLELRRPGAVRYADGIA